jgi:hypothetical protein
LAVRDRVNCEQDVQLARTPDNGEELALHINKLNLPSTVIKADEEPESTARYADASALPSTTT